MMECYSELVIIKTPEHTRVVAANVSSSNPLSQWLPNRKITLDNILNSPPALHLNRDSYQHITRDLWSTSTRHFHTRKPQITCEPPSTRALLKLPILLPPLRILHQWKTILTSLVKNRMVSISSACVFKFWWTTSYLRDKTNSQPRALSLSTIARLPWMPKPRDVPMEWTAETWSFVLMVPRISSERRHVIGSVRPDR